MEKLKAYIEEIKMNDHNDILHISNQPSSGPFGVFDLFDGYEQLGTYEVKRPHPFKEHQWVEVTIFKEKIVEVV